MIVFEPGWLLGATLLLPGSPGYLTIHIPIGTGPPFAQLGTATEAQTDSALSWLRRNQADVEAAAIAAIRQAATAREDSKDAIQTKRLGRPAKS